MSIYTKENPSHFNRCMQSIWVEQSLKPNEIILVQDGPLSDELYKAIAVWKGKLKNKLKIISLQNNVGLGDALKIGIGNCSHEIIARMDTDDISSPDRFKKQLDFLEQNPNIDIVGSWITEFETDKDVIISYRKLPEQHDEIVKFAKKRNPLNHPSVMYRKKAVVEAGNYQKMIGFEDYYLWIRMLQNGSKMENIPESLVSMRAGFSQLERRGGVKYILNEIKFQEKLLEINFINYFEFISNIFIRMTARIMPNSLRGFIYKLIRKKD